MLQAHLNYYMECFVYRHNHGQNQLLAIIPYLWANLVLGRNAWWYGSRIKIRTSNIFLENKIFNLYINFSLKTIHHIFVFHTVKSSIFHHPWSSMGLTDMLRHLIFNYSWFDFQLIHSACKLISALSIHINLSIYIYNFNEIESF